MGMGQNCRKTSPISRDQGKNQEGGRYGFKSFVLFNYTTRLTTRQLLGGLCMAIHRFIGDRHAPTPLASVRTRRAILGTGTIPAELRAMARMRALYVETDSNEKDRKSTRLNS